MKKLLFLFAFFMISSALWAQSVQDGFEFMIVDGKSVTITKYTKNAGAIQIPEQIRGLPVTAIGGWAFIECDRLTDITIPSSVMSIGDLAFAHCSSLINITIPSSVISIGDFVFSDCNILTSITVDSLNPVYASIDGVLFDKTMQTLIKYPLGKNARIYTIPSSVTSIGDWAFSGCDRLVIITMPSSVTSIRERAFRGCEGLRYITIPPSVTFIGDNAFNRCDGLQSITIPSSVKSVGAHAFSDCRRLASVTLSRRTQVGENAFPDSARIIYSEQ